MGRLTRYSLTLNVEGASPDDLERGLRVAIRIFEKADTSPQLAAKAVWDLEGQDPACWGPDHLIPPQSQARAATWVLAADEAIDACCGGRSRPPGARMALAE